MKKNTSILILVLFLFLVTMVVVFIGTLGLGFLSESNNYTGNGVSFEYPADYKITEVKGNSTFLIAKNIKNPNLTFQVSKSPVKGDVFHGMNLDEYAKSIVNGFILRGWITILDNTTLYVDDTDKEVQAYRIGYTEKLPSQSDSDSVNGDITMFDKNGMRYIIDFQGKGRQKYDGWAYIQVTASFKVL